MGKISGYMVTWTTYGSWLQGEKKGYVKNGQILAPCETLHEANKKNLISKPVKFNREQKNIVEKAILSEAKKRGHKVYALAVCSNHVHLVAASWHESIESAVSRYKNVATCTLKKAGLSGRIWTRGFDKRFCFTAQEVEKKIRYVRCHTDSG